MIGLILAGGLSTRMGEDKAKLKIDSSGLSLLEHANLTLSQVGVDQTIISSNLHVGGLPDSYSECGPIGGIHAFLQHSLSLKSPWKEALVIPVDMPQLSAQALKALVHEGRIQNKACYYESCFLPFYLPLRLSFVEQVSKQITEASDLSVRAFLRSIGACTVPSKSSSMLNNINYPSQWRDYNAIADNL